MHRSGWKLWAGCIKQQRGAGSEMCLHLAWRPDCCLIHGPGKSLPSHPRLSALWCVLGLRTFLRHRYKTQGKARQDLNTRYRVPCSSHRAWKHTDRPTTLHTLFDKSRDFLSNMMSWLYYRLLVATQCRLSYQDSISRFLLRCAGLHCIETCLTKHTSLPCFKY